jgi:hypothetical protein
MSEPHSRRRLRRDTLDELLWTLGGRRGWLVGIGINLALGVAYALYTAFNANDHFFIRSASGVAANVALFVLSDPITTNQLGADRDHVVTGLRNGESVTRILFTKNVALIIILLPLTMAISTGLRLLLDEDRTIVSAIVLDIWIVLGWLALGNLASVLAPYWPMPLKRRWRHRDSWAWWGLVLAIPYGLYYLRAWVLEPALDEVLGGQAYRRAAVDWVWGARYVGVAVGMLAISYMICALVGRRNDWLERQLLKDR